ncbi:MAG: DUF2070 family protein [Candidatus Bathyarchaeia archaeon]
MLPSYKNIILFLVLTCMISGLASSLILSLSPMGIFNGVCLGFFLLFATLFSNYSSVFFITKKDPIYNLRRTTALSLYSWSLWVLFILLGSVAAAIFGSIWAVKLCLFGFSAVLILRFIVLYATFSGDFKHFFASSIIQPFFCIIPFVIFWSSMVDPIMISLFSVYALVVSLFSSFCFIHLLNSIGERAIGKPSLAILKAFLLNWIADLNAPLEAILEELSEERDIEVSIVKFDCKNVKAFMVVPSVHPGPFKNVGSSFLPYMIKGALEQKFDCVACVPLGSLGHELDLASQTQNQKVIKYVVDSANFKGYEANATPFIKVQKGIATACCQIFGESAILSFSLAPNTTEDFPRELDFFVQKEAKKLSLQPCIVINAHNSINGKLDSKESFEALKAVAVECMKRANSLARAPFKIGAATVNPKEFSLRDGMGPGGVTAMVINVGEQKAAYIIIDGNNMISGLREEIISALKSIGIDEGEIFTTDTHSVNALILSKRGYHPVGEAIDRDKLIKYVKEATSVAVANMETARAGIRSIIIPKVRVIGQNSLEKLCLLPSKVVRRAKIIVVPLFAATSLFLALFLSFI